jgi:hypothetical protein
MEMTLQTFRTDHLYVAAFIVCRGHQLTSILGSANNRLQFVFPDTHEVRSAAAEFLAGGSVEARQFSFELLKLKRCIPRRWDNTVRRAEHEVVHRRYSSNDDS